MSAADATRHVLCCSDVAVAPARRRKVCHPAGMRALVDVISASVLGAAEQKQTCNRWLCSAAISGMGTLPKLSSPSEVIVPVGEHEICVAGWCRAS